MKDPDTYLKEGHFELAEVYTSLIRIVEDYEEQKDRIERNNEFAYEYYYLLNAYMESIRWLLRD